MDRQGLCGRSQTCLRSARLHAVRAGGGGYARWRRAGPDLRAARQALSLRNGDLRPGAGVGEGRPRRRDRRRAGAERPAGRRAGMVDGVARPDAGFLRGRHARGHRLCREVPLPPASQLRAAEEMIKTAHAAKNLGVKVVNGFTGSKIWSLLYSFPPVSDAQIEDGFVDFAKRWNPILDEFKKCKVKFALEVHPTEIAFDTASAERALAAIGRRPEFGFNFDPSHFGYQGVDYVGFIRKFADRIFHV